MKLLPPKKLDANTTWGLDLTQTEAIGKAVDMLFTQAHEVRTTWQNIRAFDAGDGWNAVCEAYNKLPAAERNKAFAISMYALQAELIMHLAEVQTHLAFLHDQEHETLLTTHTQTSTPEKDRS